MEGAGPIYTSANSGANWTATSGPAGICVASSADGTKLVAAASGTYISANSGATWTETLDDNPAAVASSTNGTKFVAVESGSGGIYTSTNSGATWTAANAFSPSGWISVASSADGTKLVAAANQAQIYISTDSGETWTATSSPEQFWVSVASSADGTKLVAAANQQAAFATNQGLIYTYVSIMPPPDITTQPSNQTVQCGAKATLSATAAGTSPMSYQWYFGTNALADGDLISGSSSTCLTLSDASISQAGSYTLTVTNSYGSVRSQPAILTVQDTNPPVITLIGAPTMIISQYSAFTDPGATAYDSCAGVLAVTTNDPIVATTLVLFNITNASYAYELVQSTDGNFYGATYYGGPCLDQYGDGAGTVFKMTPSGTLTTLLSFSGTNGANPSALVQGTDANLYGTTTYGGNGYNSTMNSGAGTVFKMTPTGTLTTLLSFSSTNGANPSALVQGTDGNLYGTTQTGGASGNGTVFKMTTNGTLTLLVSFSGTNGMEPIALVQGNDGNLYGTTLQGGTSGHGTVFMVSTDFTAFTTLHSFTAPSNLPPYANSDGAYPAAAMVQGTDGNFYGTTRQGGTSGDGTVFKMMTNGTLTTLVSFNNTNGAYPAAALVQGTDGNFYGTTVNGGADCDIYGSTCGTVFKITTNGTLTTLVSCNDSNGAFPYALVRGTDGNFYGTTALRGAYGGGTIFKMTTDTVNVNLPGTYIISYMATDPSGNSATNTRTVVVSALLAPIINVLPVSQPGGFFLQFTENPNASFTMLVSTNLALPASNWTVLGPATLSNGVFQFTDTPPTNYPGRFYRLRSP